jgi:uncharacterized Zn-finger protein
MENVLAPVTSNAAVHDEDVVIVTSTRVMCEGPGGALGHPRTYLDMGSDTSVTCKYCDRVFKLDPNAAPGGHH